MRDSTRPTRVRKTAWRSLTSRIRRCCASAGPLALAALLALPTVAPAQEIGLDGRIGHIALPAVGRSTGLTHFELMPYAIQSETHALFGDLRGFVDNRGRLGTNLGGGYRFIEPNGVFLLGANGWYDADDTTGRFFQQVGLGLEGRTEIGSLNANFYLPVGNDAKVMRRSVTNHRFDGTQILFDVHNRVGQAMRGVDTLLGFYLPGEFAREHHLEASAGWYHFQGTDVETINGVRVQFDGRVVRSLFGQVAVTHDGTFGTNVTLGLAWRFGTDGIPDTSIEGQLRRFVDRNYNVIVDRRTEIGEALAAVNPVTGLPYTVQHVSSSSSTELGTPENPWSSVSRAQAAGADLVFVHGGSTLNESITLSEGQFLLSEGMEHRLAEKTFGTFKLPTATGVLDLPTLVDAPGNGITLANGSRVAGFVIDSPDGHGIFADGASGFSVVNVAVNDAGGHGLFLNNAAGNLTDITVTGAGQDGVHLAGTSGPLEFRNVTVGSAAGHGVNVVGGHGRIAFRGRLEIEQSALDGFSVNGLETITGENGEELLGTVAVADLRLVGAAGANGVSVTDSTGHVHFNNLDVQTTNGSAIFVRDSGSVTASDGKISSVNAPVADIEDADIDLLLTSTSADGGEQGVRIVRSTGRFLAFGEGTARSGGVIKNTDVAVFLDGAEQVGFQSVDFDGNKVVANVEDSDSLTFAASRFTRTAEMIVNAVNLKMLDVNNTLFEENPLASGTGVLFQASKTGGFVAAMTNNDVTDTPATFFETRTLAGGEGATLSYGFQGNDVTLSKVQGIAAKIDWTGPVDVFVTNNKVTGSATGQTAFRFMTGNSADLSEFTINQNVVLLQGNGATAIDLKTGSPATVQANQNIVQFQGRDGVGIRVTALRASDLDISANEVYDVGGGGTGILFPSVASDSRIFMDANYLSFHSTSSAIDRGIVLSTVTGDGPPVELISSMNNVILGASTPYFVPTSGVIGNLMIEIQ